jgi:hypothetical protein
VGLSSSEKCGNFEEIKEIGFGLSHIKQLYNKKSNSPVIIQESINHFAYTLKFKPAKLQKYENQVKQVKHMKQLKQLKVKHMKQVICVHFLYYYTISY